MLWFQIQNFDKYGSFFSLPERENPALTKKSIDIVTAIAPEEEETESVDMVKGIAQEKIESQTFVPGSIHQLKFRNFWVNTLKCAPWVENVLKFGYRIPFTSIPDQYEERNNGSVRNNPEIVSSLVEALAQTGVIEFVDCKPTCVNPLGLVTKMIEGEVNHRLVLDVSRWVNLFTYAAPVRLAHLEKALEITEVDDYQTVFDLKSAYHNVKIAPEHVQYLGASIQFKGRKRYFVFKHLPFGLNCAVYAITKLWKPLTAYLHTHGIRFSIYIDDGRILTKSAEEAERVRLLVYELVQNAGWHVNWSKSDKTGESSQVKKYLGFSIDTRSMTVSYPENKWNDLRQFILNALEKPTIEAKILAKLLGRVVALLPSHGTSVRICTRSGYGLLDQHVRLRGWQGSLDWTAEAKSELQFFVLHAKNFDGAPISSSLSDITIQATDTFVSDASGFKAAVKWLEGEHAGSVATFPFNTSECLTSSGERELLAMHRLFKTATFQHQFQRANFLWLTDSTNVVAFVTKGSPKFSIQEKVFDIFVTLTRLGCSITPVHLSRLDERIQQVDHLSKVLDTDNWSIDKTSFMLLDQEFHFEMDLFADNCNRKVPVFASKYFHDEAVAVDAFSIPWVGMAWLCPPTSLIPRVIKRIRNSHCEGVLIIPNWPASSYYCLVFESSQIVQPFRLIKEFSPYITQNEGARNTPLYGKTDFTFFALYFNTL